MLPLLLQLIKPQKSKSLTKLEMFVETCQKRTAAVSEKFDIKKKEYGKLFLLFFYIQNRSYS